jgi:hypothetical protein
VTRQRRAEVERLRAELREGNARNEAMDRQPPATVRAYRQLYGRKSMRLAAGMKNGAHYADRSCMYAARLGTAHASTKHRPDAPTIDNAERWRRQGCPRRLGASQP